MAKEEMKIGEISKPRFEFRSFGQCFCEAHKRMARLSVPVPEKVWERSSDEIYIISARMTSTTPRSEAARWTSRPTSRPWTALSSGIR